MENQKAKAKAKAKATAKAKANAEVAEDTEVRGVRHADRNGM
jgi:hypothetical protein